MLYIHVMISSPHHINMQIKIFEKGQPYAGESESRTDLVSEVSCDLYSGLEKEERLCWTKRLGNDSIWF